MYRKALLFFMLLLSYKKQCAFILIVSCLHKYQFNIDKRSIIVFFGYNFN